MVDQVAGAQVLDQVAGTQVVNQVAGAQVLDQVAGTQVVDQVAGAQVAVNQVAGAQVLDQVAGTHVVDHRLCALHVDATYLTSTHLGSSRLHTVYAVYDRSHDNHPLGQKLDPRLLGIRTRCRTIYY